MNGSRRLIAGTLTLLFAFLVSACGGGDKPNTPPSANAGTAQTVFKKATVTLDGTASTDVDGDTLTFSWSQTAGPAVTLSNSSSAKPTFTAPATTSTLTFSLVVNDGHGNSSQTASVTITVQNRAPTAMAGSNTTLLPGAPYTLDGTGRSDSDGDPLTYAWTQTQGQSITLDTSVTGKATFTAPSQPGTLEFSLKVNDGEADSQLSVVMITVSVAPPPVATAGSDQTVSKRAHTLLQGSGTDSNHQPLTYQWQQVSGTPVAISNATDSIASFTAPPATGDLKFSLTVNDGTTNSQPSYVTVHVINLAPVVYSVTLAPNTPRRNDPLSATVNAGDPDGDPIALTYVWSRNGTVISGATGATYPLGNQVKNDSISVVVTASDGALTATMTATAVIADTPATLASSNAPTTATFGTATSFQVTASDVDGDPTGAIELAYGPAGMTVSSSGQVAWTPSGPLFDRTVDMHWGVRLHDAPSVVLSGTMTVTDPNRKPPLARTNTGLATGSSSLEVQDFAGDGTQEILIGSLQSVFLLQKTGTDYVQIWAYPFDTATGSTIRAVASGDIDGDGHREIFFSAGPVLVELDGVTRREIARYDTTVTGTSDPTLGPNCTSLKVADIDNDGIPEVVCLGNDSSYPGGGRILVFNARNLQLKWMTDDLVLGTAMAVGNVDSDPALEIVTSGGYVFDGATGLNQWAYAPGFGSQVDIGDVIGDGIGKIVGTASGGLTAFDAVQKSVLWTVAPGSSSGLSAIKVAKLDGTSPAEVIAADAQWGNITVYRYGSGAPQVLTQINSTGDGVTAIAAGDVDNDGQQEIVWTPAFSLSSGSPTLAISSWTPAAALKWTGPQPIGIDGPFVCAKRAQISAGQNRLIYMTPRTEDGHQGMRVIALDPTTGLFSVSQEVDSNWAQARACDVASVYGSGIDSVLLGSATLYDPYLTAFDFATSLKQWSSPKLSGNPAAITHADVNGDGTADLITIAPDGHLYAWDVLHQTLIWSVPVQGYGVDVAVADLYGDGKQEIVALTATQVMIFAQVAGGLVQTASYSINGFDLLVADTDGDGKCEIYVLASDFLDNIAFVSQFDNSLKLLNSYTVSATVGLGNSLYLEDSGFARKNLLVAVDSNPDGNQAVSNLKAIEPSSGAIVWQSPPLRGYIPINSLNMYDLHGDGQREIVFGTTMGMYVTQ